MTLSRTAIATLVDIAGIAAVASISYGAGMIYAPAGFIVAGLLTLAGVVAVARGGI